MKEKILFITNIYPDPDIRLLNTTNVCHYFVREWVQMGFEVKVIYNYTIYSKALHLIAKYFEKLIANRSLSVVNTDRIINDQQYIIEGVSVNRFPIYKAFPRIKFSKKAINKQVEKILRSNEKDNFLPDIIIGHFHNPNLELVNLLKETYTAKTCIVVHGNNTNIKKFYKNNFNCLIDNIDIWGYRSNEIRKKFENNYGIRPKSFICYSGIPEGFLINPKAKLCSNEMKNFIYVGALIKRKNPTALLYALDKAYPDKNFSLTIIGDGEEKRKMIKIAAELNLYSNVHFLSHLDREIVAKEIEASDCFIMISENETFGLVYLEAMAKGCITIGSRNEGIDGVIIDGENGFLCESGNYLELSELIKRINSLSSAERHAISLNAIETANNLTDFKAARRYLDTVLNL